MRLSHMVDLSGDGLVVFDCANKILSFEHEAIAANKIEMEEIIN
jgi:hypothetical protein